jgi:hypothetical protein
VAIVANIATFKILFPEFTDVGDDVIQFYIDMYGDDKVGLSTTYWGNTKGEAQLYASAHEIALSQNRQANAKESPGGFVTTAHGSGAMTSASGAQLSASFGVSATVAQGNDADVYFTRTEYGQRFLLLKRSRMPLGILALAV